jgi:hypothetical protein
MYASCYDGGDESQAVREEIAAAVATTLAEGHPGRCPGLREGGPLGLKTPTAFGEGR